jgi:hypothetical protein
MVKSFRDIVELWPVPEMLAAEIGASHWAVHKWRQRDTIPSEWWVRILKTETAQRHGIDADTLTRFAGRPKALARG